MLSIATAAVKCYGGGTIGSDAGHLMTKQEPGGTSCADRFIRLAAGTGKPAREQDQIDRANALRVVWPGKMTIASIHWQHQNYFGLHFLRKRSRSRAESKVFDQGLSLSPERWSAFRSPRVLQSRRLPVSDLVCVKRGKKTSGISDQSENGRGPGIGSSLTWPAGCPDLTELTLIPESDSIQKSPLICRDAWGGITP